MEILRILLSGLVGAVLVAVVTLIVYFAGRKPKRSGMAYKFLKRFLEDRLKKPEGEYYFAKSANDNLLIADYIYKHANCEIIATAFHESPASYIGRDLAGRINTNNGSLFKRITCESVCPYEEAEKAKADLFTLLPDASLIVIPKDTIFSRIDGVFCRFLDKTHLCFLSLRNPSDSAMNQGVIFRDGIAKSFFNYYQSLAEEYE